MSVFGDAAANLLHNASQLMEDIPAAILTIEVALCPVNPEAAENGLELVETIHLERIGPYEVDVVEGTGLHDARAKYTEWGTRHMAPRPHQTPAFAALRSAWANGMSRLLQP